MLTENGRVVAIQSNAIWVETINQSACGQCAAKSGCGQSLLAKWADHAAHLKISVEPQQTDQLQVNDEVVIGIPEDVVVKSALLLYLLPLALFIVLGALVSSVSDSETFVALSAFAGLLIGGAWVANRTRLTAQSKNMQPVLLNIIARQL